MCPCDWLSLNMACIKSGSQCFMLIQVDNMHFMKTYLIDHVMTLCKKFMINLSIFSTNYVMCK